MEGLERLRITAAPRRSDLSVRDDVVVVFASPLPPWPLLNIVQRVKQA